MTDEFVRYSRISIVDARPYVPGEDMDGIVVGEGMTPTEGDMIARNPRNPDVLWLVPKEVFETNYETLAQTRGVDVKAEPAV